MLEYAIKRVMKIKAYARDEEIIVSMLHLNEVKALRESI